MHVRLRADVDAELGERRLECGQHLVGRVLRVELRRAEESADIPRLRLVEPEAEARAEQSVALVFPQSLRVVEHGAAFDRKLVEPEPEALVQLVVVRCVELSDRVAVDSMRIEVEGIEVLVEEADPLLVDALPLAAIGLVRHDDARHAIRHRLPVDGQLERRLDLGRLRLVCSRQVAEEPFAREPPELGRRVLEPLRRLEPRQVLVLLVDPLDVERLLESREVVVVLLQHVAV